MKKIFAAVFICLLVFSLFGCKDKEYWHYFLRGSILTSVKESKSIISTETSPRSVYCFDKDKDGDQDLFVIADEDLVYDFENAVGGRFATPPPAYVVESTPQRMAIADFNGDHFLDMAVTNQTSNDFALLINSYSGNFNNMVFQQAGDEPFAIAADDMDKNGTQDLVIGNLADNSISIFSNVKNEEFEMKAVKPVGEMPFGITTSDIDKNGYPDILTINYESNDLSVIRNAGDFYFHDEDIYPITGNPSAIVSLDFNGDKYYDVAITQFESDSVTILLNNKKGGFDQSIQFPTGVSPVSLVAVDMDYNGWEDLIVANTDEDSLSFFMNGPEYMDRFKYGLTPNFKANHLNVGLLNDNQFYDLVLCDYKNKKILLLFDVIAPHSF